MTCIVGIPKPGGGVIIGGDSAGVAGLHLTIRADEKVFSKGPFVMGFTSSFRMGQLLRYNLKVPEQDPGQGDVEYMTTSFIDSVRSCLDEGGWIKKNDERESGGTFLVGYKGCVYEIENDFQVGIPLFGYAAVGSGFAIAQGSLYSTDHIEDFRERAFLALDAASKFNAGVHPPFKFIEN